MKMRQTVTHNDLIIGIHQQLRSRFVPSNADIKVSAVTPLNHWVVSIVFKKLLMVECKTWFSCEFCHVVLLFGLRLLFQMDVNLRTRVKTLPTTRHKQRDDGTWWPNFYGHMHF